MREFLSHEIERIGVVGAGTMGHGIAQVAAQSGYGSSLVDVVPAGARARRGGRSKRASDKLVAKGKLTDAEQRERRSRG